MTNKEIFIKSIQEEIDNGMELPDEAVAYFEELKNGKASLGGLTVNGKIILGFLQNNFEQYNNIFTSKNIAEKIGVPSRSVSGAIRKLVSDGYVKKLNSNPVSYELTDLGKDFQIDN